MSAVPNDARKAKCFRQSFRPFNVVKMRLSPLLPSEFMKIQFTLDSGCASASVNWDGVQL